MTNHGTPLRFNHEHPAGGMSAGVEMWSECNLRCEYCTGPRSPKRDPRGRTREDADAFLAFLRRTAPHWSLCLSGGEPMLHPQFEYLLKAFAERGYMVSLMTNLTQDVGSFRMSLPPERCGFVKASYHLSTVDSRDWRYRTHDLAADGFPVQVVVVSSMDRRMTVEHMCKKCSAVGIPFTLAVMEGPWRRKLYPRDYTDEEAEWIESYTTEPGNLMRLWSGTAGGMNTFKTWCPAGHDDFVIDLDTGAVNQCESVNKSIGNVYTRDWNPRPAIGHCPAVNGCVAYNRNPRMPCSYRTLWSYLGKGPTELPDVRNDTGRRTVVSLFPFEAGAAALLHVLHHICEEPIASPVWIWGAGVYGGKLYAALAEHCPELQIGGIVDAMPEAHGRVIGGHTVTAPDTMIENNVGTVIPGSYCFESEIASACRSMGLHTVRLHADVAEPLGYRGGLF